MKFPANLTVRQHHHRDLTVRLYHKKEPLPMEFEIVALLVTAAVDAVVSCDSMADARSTANSEGLEAANSGRVSA